MLRWHPPAVVMACLVALAGCLEKASEEDTGVGEGTCPLGPIEVVQDLQVDNLSGGARVGDTARQDFPFPLTGALTNGTWGCARAVEATIRWSNGPTAGADLYVGLEIPAASIAVVGNDHQQLALDGEHAEAVMAPAPWADPDALEDGLILVVYSDWAALSDSSLPVQATVRIHLA